MTEKEYQQRLVMWRLKDMLISEQSVTFKCAKFQTLRIVLKSQNPPLYGATQISTIAYPNGDHILQTVIFNKNGAPQILAGVAALSYLEKNYT